MAVRPAYFSRVRTGSRPPRWTQWTSISMPMAGEFSAMMSSMYVPSNFANSMWWLW